MLYLFIALYFLIGLAFSCIVNYIKGKKHDLSVCSEIEFEMVATIGAFIWPVVIFLLVFVWLIMRLSKPFVALASYCEELGRRHRG